ncbi:MAG: DNA polymerase [Eubacterium sp.]
MKRLLYTADFETTTDPDDCRVWAWAMQGINDDVFMYGNSLDSFMEQVQQAQYTLYFHNLKFDGEFILHYLLTHNYTWVKDKKKMKANTFTTLINDMGAFYSIEICFAVTSEGKRNVIINDSLKLIPLSVAQTAKAFGLSISKLDLDYKQFRPVGHELTPHEVDYIKNDVSIMAQALRFMFNEGLTKMTIGSNALSEFKRLYGKKRFEHSFPPPEEYDKYLRSAYRGGFTYVNPRYKDKDIGAGIVLDVNSLYPSVMYYCPMPYGEGVFYEGKYETDEEYPLYIQVIKVSFDIKENCIPTLQIKNSVMFQANEYLTTSEGEIVTLSLTSVDLKLFLEQYDCEYIEYINGWKFRSCENAFKEYIDKWMKVKIEATETGNKGMRQIAKLMLNNLYGKFATNPLARSKIPYLDTDDNKIHYSLSEQEKRKAVYIPVGCFITAWARDKTIRSAQSVYDRFIYADTDSLHLIGTEVPAQLEISPTDLGAWKHESTFSRARFLKQKTYIEEIDGELKVTCAGMPYNCHQYVTWDNFHFGAEFAGKLKQKRTQGGVILEEGFHTLKQ